MYVRNAFPEKLRSSSRFQRGKRGSVKPSKSCGGWRFKVCLTPPSKSWPRRLSKGSLTGIARATRRVHQFAKDHMQYVADTANIEEITSPAIHAKRFLSSGTSWGDCDDFSTLQAALLKSVGVSVRFVVVASPRNGGQFDHVRLDAFTQRGWLPLESTIKNSSFGQSFKVLRSKIYPIE